MDGDNMCFGAESRCLQSNISNDKFHNSCGFYLEILAFAWEGFGIRIIPQPIEPFGEGPVLM